MKEIRCPACHTANWIEVWDGEYQCLTCGESFSARESYGQNLVKMISKASKMVMDKRKKSEKPKSLIGKAPELLALSRYTGRLVSKAPEVAKLIKLFL